jgi:hypothetical protein
MKKRKQGNEREGRVKQEGKTYNKERENIITRNGNKTKVRK